jgi:hypothetical protein
MVLPRFSGTTCNGLADDLMKVTVPGSPVEATTRPSASQTMAAP